MNKVTLVVILIFTTLSQTAVALDAPTAAPSVAANNSPIPSTNPDPEVAQFQKWLKSNTPGSTPPPSLATTAPPAPLPRLVGSATPSNTTTTTTVTTKKVISQPKKYSMMFKSPDSPTVISPPLSYNQSQAIMMKSAPAPVVPSSDEATEAFNAMIQQNVPLTPQQVVKLRQVIDRSQRAAAIPATVPPKPVSSTIMINLAPGATPPAIRLAQGYVSSLVFVDSTGAPWPLAAYDIGDPKTMTIQWDGKSNILLMQAISPYSDGNLVIRLVGLATPVTLEIVSGQRVVDYRTDIHVPGIGPNSKDLPTGTGLPNSANQLLLGVLDGVAPGGSKQLMVSGGECQAWLLGDRMYLRTRLTLLSPGWVGRMTSPDGMYAYEIPRTSSVLVSQYGNPIELKIEGF